MLVFIFSINIELEGGHGGEEGRDADEGGGGEHEQEQDHEHDRNQSAQEELVNAHHEMLARFEDLLMRSIALFIGFSESDWFSHLAGKIDDQGQDFRVVRIVLVDNTTLFLFSPLVPLIPVCCCLVTMQMNLMPFLALCMNVLPSSI